MSISNSGIKLCLSLVSTKSARSFGDVREAPMIFLARLTFGRSWTNISGRSLRSVRGMSEVIPTDHTETTAITDGNCLKAIFCEFDVVEHHQNQLNRKQDERNNGHTNRKNEKVKRIYHQLRTICTYL